MHVHELLEQCCRYGVTLTPAPEGKLRVSPPGKLPDDLREALKQHKAEVLVLLTKPYLTSKGELRIPFTSDRRYHWWAGGQSIAETLQELNAPPDVWRRYVPNYTEEKQ